MIYVSASYLRCISEVSSPTLSYGVYRKDTLTNLHVTAARRVDAAAAGAQARVPLHEVDQLQDCVWAEVDVTVEGLGGNSIEFFWIVIWLEITF